MKIKLFDTTLRDGTQGEGVSCSVEDKIKIVQRLDEFGIDYIEGGWPGSNPKDELLFKKMQSVKLKHARLVAFGSTRHKDCSPNKDKNLLAMVAVKTPVVCIFGKSWDLHVRQALRAELDDNLKMIADSVRFLKSKKLEVIYDAEHFFDGYKANSQYALKTLESAIEAGADNITLCDTNGGMLPHEIKKIINIVKTRFPKISLGIHAHNDSGCAAANSLVAVSEGVNLVQGTINGYGERCGNADLCVIIPNLKYKMMLDCLTDKQLSSLTELSRFVSEITNMIPNDRQPYVGNSAFAHKAGVHVSAMARNTKTYEHINPELVGNRRRILISELSGRTNVLAKAKEFKIDFDKDKESTKKILDAVKKMEHQGYQFEGAEESFILLTQKAVGKYKPFFELEGFRVIIEKDHTGKMFSEATIKLYVNGKEEHTAAEGDGPVNALDNALRKALEKFYPELKQTSLTDFKVRVIDANAGTGAKVRVLIETRDQTDEWSTIGVSPNIIEASWQALVDAVEYKLFKTREKSGKPFK